MIPAQTLRSVESSPVAASASFGISQADVAHILTMLRDTLYSDRILAVLREYGANAWDVHREVGRGNVPICVTLPTLESPTLEIRDYGTGISQEDMLGRFLLAGASTKRGSNIAVGTLGIGRLSGFAYGDSFVVESRHGNVCSTYAAVIDASERGRIDLLDEQPATDTGLAVRLAVRAGDVAEFREKAIRLFAHMQPQPEINALLPAQGERVGDGALTDGGGWTAVMGCIPYPIDLGQIGAPDFVRNLSGVLYFDVGDLHFAASREALKYTDQTRRAVRGKLDAFLDEYVRGQVAAIESASTSPWDKRVRSLSLLRFPLPWLRLDETAPTSIDLPDFATLSICTRDGRKKYKASAISVHRASRIVIRDDKRALLGFRFGDRDYIATPGKENTLGEAESELGRAVASLGIVGIPMTRTSALSWIAPPRRERMGRGGVSAPRGQAFKLRPSYGYYSPYSRHWETVRRDPEASDVYVVLDAFRCDAFYAAYQSDVATREALRLDPLPVVYGYKIGHAPTVGQTYAAWRETYLADAAKLPRVRELFAQYAAHGLCDTAPSAAQLTEIETRLGAEHPVAVLCRRISAAHAMPHSVKWALRDLLAQTKTKAPAPDDRALRRYPLLAAEGIKKLWDKNATAWLDYVAGKKKKGAK